MSQNLDAMSIEIGEDKPKSDRPGRSEKVKNVFRQGTVVAGTEWSRSKKNMGKLFSLKTEDFNVKRLVGHSHSGD